MGCHNQAHFHATVKGKLESVALCDLTKGRQFLWCYPFKN